jgi:ubiquinone biosynthesis protein
LNVKVDVPWRDKVSKREVQKIRNLSTPQRVRLTLEELGPTYVKFGQVLSSRADLLPDDFIKELSKLQDDVSPFPFQDVRMTIEEQLGRPLVELYDDFEEKPSAAASLSQVHHARTKDGEEVAVKVQRPGIAEVIDLDIRALRRLVVLADRSLPEFKAYQLVAIVDEFAKTIRRELDFVREGQNADRFREFFQSDETVHVPKVYWKLTATKVLTLEYIRGTKVSECADLDALGLDRKIIAFNGANLILKEIFDFHRFHADPHPGNLFVLKQNVIAPVDFGMIGVLDEETVDQLSLLFTAIVDKDARWMANVLLRMCRAAEPIQTRAIQLELLDLLERYHEVPLQRLHMKDIIGDVTGISRRYELRFPQELVMITRALLMIESVGCGLYPEFNVLDIMKPFARKLVFRRSDPITRVRDLVRTVDESATLLKTLPSDVREILAKIKRDEFAIRFEHRGLERMSAILDRSSNRLSFAIVIAALVIGSSIVLQTGVGPRVFGSPLPGLAGLLLATILGLWLLVGILRSGKL